MAATAVSQVVECGAHNTRGCQCRSQETPAARRRQNGERWSGKRGGNEGVAVVGWCGRKGRVILWIYGNLVGGQRISDGGDLTPRHGKPGVFQGG